MKILVVKHRINFKRIFGKPKLKSQDQRVSSKTSKMKLGCRHPCPLIYLKVVSELLALIFFAVASGICFTLYLTAKKLQNEFEGVFDRQRDVLVSASIVYAILFILSFLATSYTVHLLSDYFEKDDHYFDQLWKLLGQDKIKTPLPSPHDEEPKQDDENTYLEPIVHFEGPAISGKSQPTEPQKPAAAAMFSFVYNQGQTLPEEMNYSKTLIEKIPKHVDFESFIFEKFPCRPVFDISIKPAEPNQSDATSPEKLICNDIMVSKIPSNVNLEDIILQNDPSKIERMLDL